MTAAEPGPDDTAGPIPEPADHISICARLWVVPGAVALGAWLCSVPLDLLGQRNATSAEYFGHSTYWLMALGILGAVMASTRAALSRRDRSGLVDRSVLLVDVATVLAMVSFLVRSFVESAFPVTPLWLIALTVGALIAAVASLPDGLGLWSSPEAPQQ